MRYLSLNEIFTDNKGIKYKVVGLRLKDYQIENIETGNRKSTPRFKVNYERNEK